MILGISGTPGCGKTTLAKQLANTLSFKYFDVTDFVKKNKLYESFDEQTQSYIIDTPILDEAILKELNKEKSYVIDSHLSQEFSFIDKLIVCKCELPILKKRLEERHYSEEKVRENLDAEIFDICYIDAIENNIETIKIDCTNPISKEKEKELISSSFLDL